MKVIEFLHQKNNILFNATGIWLVPDKVFEEINEALIVPELSMGNDADNCPLCIHYKMCADCPMTLHNNKCSRNDSTYHQIVTILGDRLVDQRGPVYNQLKKLVDGFNHTC